MHKQPLIILYLFAAFLAGCASISTTLPPAPKKIAGTYHRVKKGQTLWRIAKSYNVEMAKIAQVNRFADTSRIYEGQLIFIPGAFEEKQDLTLQTDSLDLGGDFIWPLKGKVNSFFGMKRDQVKNSGISIQVKKGALVVAARSGKVAFCSDALKGYGKIIIIDHLDGYYTVYAHNSKNLVRLEELVRQGQSIARAGASGRVNLPELYFEIRKGHQPQNPFFYLP